MSITRSSRPLFSTTHGTNFDMNNSLLKAQSGKGQTRAKGLGNFLVFVRRKLIEDFVDEAIVSRFPSGQEPVAVGIASDDLQRLACVFGQNFIENLPRFENVFRLN